MADVLDVKMEENADGTYNFHVTVRSQDKGWEKYCNWWRLKTKEGQEIARRTLMHPHVNEQPFTRALYNVKIPEGVKEVIVEAHDSREGYIGKTFTIHIRNG